MIGFHVKLNRAAPRPRSMARIMTPADLVPVGPACRRVPPALSRERASKKGPQEFLVPAGVVLRPFHSGAAV